MVTNIRGDLEVQKTLNSINTRVQAASDLDVGLTLDQKETRVLAELFRTIARRGIR